MTQVITPAHSALAEKFTALLNGRTSRKVDNNTYLRREEDGTIALRLHATDIIRVRPDGAAQVETGGWQTLTTRDRLNNYLPVRIYQERAVWFWNLTPRVPFTDGDIIAADGTLQPQATAGTEAALKKADRAILAYAKKCADAVPLDRPGGGDCFFCQAKVTDALTGKPSANTSHLQSHIDEGYVVPSLVYHALTEAGNTPLIVATAFKAAGDGSPAHTHFNDIARDRVKSAVAKYLRRHLKGAK